MRFDEIKVGMYVKYDRSPCHDTTYDNITGEYGFTGVVVRKEKPTYQFCGITFKLADGSSLYSYNGEDLVPSTKEQFDRELPTLEEINRELRHDAEKSRKKAVKPSQRKEAVVEQLTLF